MIIEIKELCEVENMAVLVADVENDKPFYSIRTVTYESDKNTLLETFAEYESQEFSSDRIIHCEDEFEGGCLDVIKVLSVKEIRG